MFVTDFNDLRAKIVDTIKKISDVPIDDSPNSYISQIINAIAVADDNILFYISMLLNESNINTAILPETITQVAKVLGVDLATPTPASSLIELHVEIQPEVRSEYLFDSNFTLVSPDDPNVVYMLTDDIRMIYDNITKKSYVYFDKNNRPISSYITSDSEGKVYVVFSAEFIQLKKTITEFYASEDLYQYDLKNPQDLQRYKLEVYVNDIPYDYVSTIYLLRDNAFTYSIYDTITRVYFATDFVATPIPEGAKVTIISYDTLGSKGNVVANTLIVGSNVADVTTGLSPNINVYHIDIKNGKDADSLLEYKNKMFISFLSRDTILSRKYDLENIGYYLNGISKYNLSVLKRSISPEFTTFVELMLNDNFINTNSVKLTDVTQYVLPQDIIFDNLLPNNTYSCVDSTLNKSITQIDENENTCICPFSMKYNPELKIVNYYYIHKRLFMDTTPNISLISSYDNITSISFDFVEGIYNPDDSTYAFTIKMTANTPNIDDVFDPNIFKFYVEIVNEESGGIVCTRSTDLKNLLVEFDEATNQPYLQFSEYTSLFVQDMKYFIRVRCSFRGSTISEYVTNSVELYSKMSITSNVNIISEFKKYVSPQVLDNSPSYTNADGVDLTPPGLFTKGDIIFYPDKVQVNVYKTDQNVSSFSLTSITDVRFKINNTVFNLKPISKTDSSLTFEVAYPVDYISGVYVIEFLLYNATNTIQYLYHEIDLSKVPSTTNYEIYHVPVVKYSDYKEIVYPNVPDLPYYQIENAYNALDDKVIIGVRHNIKFIKTFGRVINIKYNKGFKYPDEYIDAIQLPINMNVSLVVSNKFNPVTETMNIVNTIQEYQKEHTAIENNLKSSALEAKVTEAVNTIYKVDITNPPVDIIYDLDDEIRTLNYNEYVPELIIISNVSISYSTSIQ